MARSAELRQILAEIEQADMATVLEGGGAVLAVIGGAILKKIGYEPDGKAEVKIDIDLSTVITITWPQDSAEEGTDDPHA